MKNLRIKSILVFSVVVIFFAKITTQKTFATNYSSSAVTQITTIAAAGVNNQEILRVLVTGAGGGAAASVCSIQFTMQNTDNADISNAKLYYTATSSTFATTTLLGTVANPTGTITFTINHQVITGTNYYYWLAYDIKPSAPNCNSFDAFVPTNGLVTFNAGPCGTGTNRTPTTNDPSGNRTIEAAGCWKYCTPVYTSGCGLNDFINKFVFNTICNSGSGCTNTTATAYTNYPSGSFYTSVFPGATYTATITVGAGTGTHGAGIWIDFNNDGDFQDADEFTLVSNTISPSTTVSVEVAISGSAVIGETRMRVRYVYDATPAVDQTYDCSSDDYGEAEDYTVNICGTDPGYASATTLTPCSGSSITLTDAGYTTSSTFQWMSSSDLCSWADIGGATSDNYTTPALAAGTYYYICKVTNGCYTYSNILTVVASSAAVGGTATPTAGSVACAGSTTVTLSGSTGTIQWQISTDGGITYSDITGATTSPLSTGALYSDSKYRAKLTGCTVDYSTVATVNVTGSGSTSWKTTAATTDWFTAGNWTNGVPSTCVDALIQAGANQPVMSGAAANCRNLTIDPSATLTVNSAAGGKLLSVYGNITNNGTFTHNSGGYNTVFYGKSSTIGGTGTWNGTSGPLFYFSTASYTLTNNVYSYYTTINANSTLSLSSYTYVCAVASGFKQYGICNINTGTLEIRGSGAGFTSSKLNHNTGTLYQNYAVNIGLSFNDDDFYNLKINDPGFTMTMGVNRKVANNWEIVGGTLAGSTYTQTIGENTVGTNGTTGNFTNNGTFTANTSTIIMKGANAQSIDGTSTTTFYKLTNSNTTATVTVSPTTNLMNVTNTLNMNGSATVLSPVAAVVINNAAAAGTISGNGTIMVSRIAATADYVNQYKFITNTLSNMTVNYSGAGNQTVNSTVGNYGGIIISGSGTKTLQGAITSNGVVTITAGTLDASVTSYTINIAGNWSNNSTFTQRSGLVNFNGSAAQSISGSTATTFYNFTLANTSTTGVTLAQPITINNILTLTDGNLITDNTNFPTLIAGSSVSPVGGSTTSFVDGPMAKTGTTSFIFPVGDVVSGTGVWRRIEIGTPTASVTFKAEFVKAAYGDMSILSEGAATMDNVHNNQYWNLTEDIATVDATVKLYWEDATAEGIDNCADLCVAHFNGTDWHNPYNGSFATTGLCTGTNFGTIATTVNVTDFSPFKLGSKGVGLNPLPIGLLNFNAYPVNNVVAVNWITATEINNDYFTVERSKEGENFEYLITVDGAGNSNETRNYKTQDPNPYYGVSYYRLKQTDFDGKFTYSNIVAVNIARTYDFSVKPNPVQNKLYVSFTNIEETGITLNIYSSIGQIVFGKQITAQKGVNEIPVELSALQQGIYFIRISSEWDSYYEKVLKE